MKCLDLLKTDYCEHVCQGCFHWSRTNVRASKTIRYRLSINRKPCRLEMEVDICTILSAPDKKSRSLSSGGVYARTAGIYTNWWKGATTSGACGLIRLSTGKLSRSRHSKDWHLWGAVSRTFALRKLKCFMQVYALNPLAWNNHIGPRFYFVVF